MADLDGAIFPYIVTGCSRFATIIMFPLSGGRCEAGPLGRREDVAAQVSLQDEIRRLGPDTYQLNMQRGPVNIFKVP